MTDDDWQLEAVHEQFNVFEKITKPYKEIPDFDLAVVIQEVSNISRVHFNNNDRSKWKEKSPRRIGLEIMKHGGEGKIYLSFIVIVTNQYDNGSLCKMPVFVMMSPGKKKFLDMNLTLFNSWDAFLKHNHLPPCQFCFPVDGQYLVGGKLKIDFDSSPAFIRQNVHFGWKCLGFVVAIGVVAASFFFQIKPDIRRKANSLLSIAEAFIPSIEKYGIMILNGITAVQKLKSGDVIEGLSLLCKFLMKISEEFKEEIAYVLEKVRNALWKLYSWIRKICPFFREASPSAQHHFVATVSAVNADIIATESEADIILEDSRKMNQNKSHIAAVTAELHHNTNPGNESEYADSIFRNAENEYVMQNGMKSKNCENLHPQTKKLLEFSDFLAQNRDKASLQDVENNFEALSSIINEEYKNKLRTYSKMLEAARVGAGHDIDILKFNQSLGIEGDPKKYYWNEATECVLKEKRLRHLVDREVEQLEKEKHIFIIPMAKPSEEDVVGFYWFTGVHGAGKFSTDKFIEALKKLGFDMNEKQLVINETEAQTVIHSGDLTFAALQNLNTEKTSEGPLYVFKAAA